MVAADVVSSTCPRKSPSLSILLLLASPFFIVAGVASSTDSFVAGGFPAAFPSVFFFGGTAAMTVVGLLVFAVFFPFASAFVVEIDSGFES